MNRNEPPASSSDRSELAVQCEELLRHCDDSAPDLREIAELVRGISALNQQVLKAANACTGGLQQAISSPEHAVALLGAARIGQFASQILLDQQHNLAGPQWTAAGTRPGSRSPNDAQ